MHCFGYYGHYSNKLRGMRAKADTLSCTESDTQTIPDEVNVIDVSKYQPKNVPSLTWRECIALKRLKDYGKTIP